MKSERLEALLSAALTLAAIVIAITFAYQQFGTHASIKTVGAEPPVFDAKWREYARLGNRLSGDADSKIVILEFADYQCPFCQRYQPTLEAVGKKFGNDVSVVLIQLPLTIHNLAPSAAYAAECGSKSGHFAAISDLLFRKQDSLGLKSWSSFASEAGIADTSQFKTCTNSREIRDKIATVVAAAGTIGIHATPTLIVNGWQYSAPPARAILLADIDSLLHGKGPDGK